MRIVAITVTGKGREAEFLASGLSFLMNIHGVEWIVAEQDKPNPKTHALLTAAAEANDNKVRFLPASSSESHTQSFARVLATLDLFDPTLALFSFDDDHVFTRNTLDLVGRAAVAMDTRPAVYTCSAVDALNIHGYEDWTNKPRPLYTFRAFVDRFGYKSAAHQRWSGNTPAIVRTDYISNGWLVPAGVFLLPDIRRGKNSSVDLFKLLCKWPRGLWGFHCLIQEILVAHEIPIYLMLNAWINHIGMWPQRLQSGSTVNSPEFDRQVAERIQPEPARRPILILGTDNEYEL